MSVDRHTVGMLVFVLSMSWPGRVHAQAPVMLDDDDDKRSLGARIELFEDPTGQRTLDEVASDAFSARFQPSHEDPLVEGYTTSAYWARFTLVRRAVHTDWLLVVSYKSLDHVSLYTPDGAGGYTEHRTGDALPFHTRAIRHRSFAFPLDLPADQPQTFYLRIASKGPVRLPIAVWSAEAFAQRERRMQFFLGAFFGILAIMVVYNLVSYFAFRDRSYLYYVLYIGSYICYQVSLERMGFEYLWPEGLWWAERANNVTGLFCAIWGLTFTRSFLHTPDFVPRLDRVLQGLVIACPLLIALHLLASGPALNPLTVLFFIVVVVTTTVTAVTCLLRGDRAARYYLLAWSFLLAGILASMLGNLGLVSYNVFSARSLQIGSVLEVMLLSLGLGYRYNLLRQERERMRLRIASDLHDDIGSGLTQISLYSELVRRNAAGQSAQWADEMGALARNLAGRMQDIVWAIQPKEETWDALEIRMKTYAAHLLAASHMTFEMQGTRKGAPRRLAPDVRQNVLLMFKEIVHNAVKHAAGRHVKVRWQLSPQALYLRICDDGQGFDRDDVKQGNGLDSLHRRAREIGATLTLDTAPGRSTCYEIDIPLTEPP